MNCFRLVKTNVTLHRYFTVLKFGFNSKSSESDHKTSPASSWQQHWLRHTYTQNDNCTTSTTLSTPEGITNVKYLFFNKRSSRFRVVSSITADADKFPFRTMLSSLEFKACTETITHSKLWRTFMNAKHTHICTAQMHQYREICQWTVNNYG